MEGETFGNKDGINGNFSKLILKQKYFQSCKLFAFFTSFLELLNAI